MTLMATYASLRQHLIDGDLDGFDDPDVLAGLHDLNGFTCIDRWSQWSKPDLPVRDDLDAHDDLEVV